MESGSAAHAARTRLPLGALVFPAFAMVWVGALVSNVGGWVENVCQNWLVYEQSGSTEWSGVFAFASLLPAAFLAIPMGIVADRIDRRKLYFALQVAFTIMAAVQAVAAHLGWTQPWVVTLIALGEGIVAGAVVPVWASFTPELVPRESLASAIALNSAQFNMARVLGPAVATWVIARYGIAIAFDVNVASFALLLGALLFVRTRPRERAAPKDWASELRAAIGFMRGDHAIRTLIATSVLYFLFACPVFTLLPALAARQLGGQVDRYGHLLSAIGAGAIAGAAVCGALSRLKRRRATMAAAAFATALAHVGLAVSRNELVSLGLLFVWGAGWSVLLTTLSTALQLLVPDSMRGRIMSVNFFGMVVAGPVGQLASGFLAGAIGLPAALVTLAAGVGLVGLWNVFLAEPVVDVTPTAAEPALASG